MEHGTYAFGHECIACGSVKLHVTHDQKGAGGIVGRGGARQVDQDRCLCHAIMFTLTLM